MGVGAHGLLRWAGATRTSGVSPPHVRVAPHLENDGLAMSSNRLRLPLFSLDQPRASDGLQCMLAQKYGKHGRTRIALPRWASRGFGTGIALSLAVPVAVILAALFPGLKPGYPLVLVPLLAVGPVAVRGLR